LAGGPAIVQALFPQQEIYLPDDKILVGLTLPDQGGQSSPPGRIFAAAGASWPPSNAIEIMRLNADGSLDTTFGNNGKVILQPDLSDSFDGFAVQSDGKIVIAASEIFSNNSYVVASPLNEDASDEVWADSGFGVLRLNSDGSTDSSFASTTLPGYRVDSMGFTGSIGGVTIQADGKILLAGEAEGMGNSTVFVARFDSDGLLDGGFASSGPQPGIATTSLVNTPLFGYPAGYGSISAISLDNGQIVLAGSQSSSGITVFSFNSDGSLDTAFGSNGIASYSPGGQKIALFSGLAVQPDGKLVIEGFLENTPGTSYSLGSLGLVLVRMNPDGSYDNSFGDHGVVQLATSADPVVSTAAGYAQDMYWGNTDGLAIEGDGKIVVGGSLIDNLNGNVATQAVIVRFNADGSLDSSFGANGVQFTTPYGDSNPNEPSAPLSESTLSDGSVVVIASPVYIYAGNWPGPIPDLVPIYLNGAPPPPIAYPPSNPSPPAPVSPPGDPTPAPVPPPGSIGNGPGTNPIQQPPERTPPGKTTAPITIADAVFQGFQQPTPSPASLEVTETPIGDTTSSLTPVPVPGTSQTMTVARLSGGGDATIAVDDVLFSASEPVWLWNAAYTSENYEAA
jgi:uncharacterized delta-60 repeat protein